MLPTGNTRNSMMTLLRTTTGLTRMVADIGQPASAFRRAAKAVHLFDISTSLAHSAIHSTYGDLRAVSILSAAPKAGTPHRISKRKGSIDLSSATDEGGTGVTRGRAGTRTLPHKTLPDVGKVLRFFHKVVSLLRGTITASERSTKRKHRGHVAKTPSLSDAYAQALASLWRLGRATLALEVPVFTRALLGTTHAMDWLTTAARRHSFISAAIGAAVAAPFATALVGAAHLFFQNTLIPAFIRGWQDVRWLLRSLGTLADFVTMLADFSLGWYLVIAAIAALGVAGYELYRHWDAAKRMMSRWIEAVHRTLARLVKWTADNIRSASAYAYAGHSTATVTVETRNALHLPTTAGPVARAATRARGMNRARAVEHAATVARSAPVLRAVRRAAAAATFVAPLMLAGAPAGAFAAPFIPTNDTARIAAPLPAVRSVQGPIVINYAPNVIIHSESGADNAALKRRVMEVLERHGRELHQVLAREIVRQQRTDF
jgi:hypothetical protein